MTNNGDVLCAKKLSLRTMFQRTSGTANRRPPLFDSRHPTSDGSNAPTDITASHHTTTGRRIQRKRSGYDTDDDSDIDNRPKGSVFFRCFGGGPSVRHNNQIRSTKSTSIRARESSNTAGVVRRSSYADSIARQTPEEDSFFTAESGDLVCEPADAITVDAITLPRCGDCSYECHVKFDPEFPLITPPGVTPGSYEEMLAIAKACQGYWVTIVDRSESLDMQYRALGLGTLKRSVMNRIAVPITMFLEENDTILHNWLHTPLGIRHMCTNLHGLESEDNDPDAGIWHGTAEVVDWVVPLCSKPVRAIRQTRFSEKVGKSIETRVILPDTQEGKICFYNFAMEPKGKSEKYSANRILKYEGAKAP